MKKIIIYCVLAFTALVGCREEHSNSGNNLQEKSILKASDVRFANFNEVKAVLEDSNRMIEGAGVGFEFRLGRKSRNCFGFGICELTAFWVDIWRTGSDYKFKKNDLKNINSFSGVIVKKKNKGTNQSSQRVPLEGIEPDYAGYVVWDEPVRQDVYDTTFYVDEDIVVDNQYVIKAGAYPLTNSLGNYGGYELAIEKL